MAGEPWFKLVIQCCLIINLKPMFEIRLFRLNSHFSMKNIQQLLFKLNLIN